MTRFSRLAKSRRGFHRDGRAVRQGLQQVHLFRRRLVARGPVRADGADGLHRADGHHHQALHERGPVRVVRDARVRVDVFDDDGLPVEHRPAADAGAHREALAFPQRRDRVFVRRSSRGCRSRSTKVAPSAWVSSRAARRTIAGDRFEVARQGKSLHHRDELLHAAHVVFRRAHRRAGRLWLSSSACRAADVTGWERMNRPVPDVGCLNASSAASDSATDGAVDGILRAAARGQTELIFFETIPHCRVRCVRFRSNRERGSSVLPRVGPMGASSARLSWRRRVVPRDGGILALRRCLL